VPDTPKVVGRGLAAAFLAGDWKLDPMTRRGQRAVGQRRVWVRNVAAAAIQAYPNAPRDRPRELAGLLAACSPLLDELQRLIERGEPNPSVTKWEFAPTEMSEPRWPVAVLDTIGDFHDLVGMTTAHTRWLADMKQLERLVDDERLRHYRYRWAVKQSGGVRLIEEPKPMLKHLQRVILREILSPVPVHPAAHGFRPGYSAVTHAAIHTRHAVVVRLDLEDFFGSVAAGRVYGLFRSCGYPESVAHLLTALVTNSIPRRLWRDAPVPPPDVAGAHERLGRHLASPHLPQGAPSSPALANLVAFGLDRRLSGLASSAGFVYTRYADDLALSSPTQRSASHIAQTIDRIRTIVVHEGFRINEGKTLVRRAGERQRLTGLVVNEIPNVDRREYDRLKAMLTNAARHGPTSQNHANVPDFRSHLRGRIGWMTHVNPGRGARLRTLYDRIDWSDGAK
jgi:hypothetical protein